MVAESLPYGWQERSPKQVAAIVLLILMAMVLSFVELPVVPGAEWLKYDPSGIVSETRAARHDRTPGKQVAFGPEGLLEFCVLKFSCT